MLPGLASKDAFRRMMAYLMFGAFYSEMTGRLVISRPLMAHIISGGDQAERQRYLSGNKRVHEFLQAFKREVLPGFEWSSYQSEEGQAREVITSGFPPELEALLEAERTTLSPERVYFDDGKKPSAAKAREERRAMQQETIATITEAGSDEARNMLSYLNQLPPHRFTKVVRQNFDQAWELALDLQEQRKRQAALNLLRVIREQPQPFYRPSRAGRTVRLYPLNESMLLLKKDVRKALTQGWAEYDLRSSQLAIVATTWGIPSARAFLESGKSIWAELNALYELEPAEETKKAFKTALYSLIFGMSRPHIEGKLTRDFMKLRIRRKGARLFDHALIQDLLSARERKMREVEAQGYGDTIFGKRIPVVADEGEPERTNVRSIMAEQAQAVELALIYPVFELAATSDDFDIVLFQHDGFSVAYTEPQARERVEGRLVSVVEAKAEELDVVTGLDGG